MEDIRLYSQNHVIIIVWSPTLLLSWYSYMFCSTVEKILILPASLVHNWGCLLPALRWRLIGYPRAMRRTVCVVHPFVCLRPALRRTLIGYPRAMRRVHPISSTLVFISAQQQRPSLIGIPRAMRHWANIPRRIDLFRLQMRSVKAKQLS